MVIWNRFIAVTEYGYIECCNYYRDCGDSAPVNSFFTIDLGISNTSGVDVREEQVGKMLRASWLEAIRRPKAQKLILAANN